jgi:hypothetical protein
VKIALVFYIVCALFNFIFNLNSFYPNMNSRKLLQEEAEQIRDTIQYNLSQYPKLVKLGSSSDIEDMKRYRDGCLFEIEKSKGFGENAKDFLKSFNDVSKKYSVGEIGYGSVDLQNKNAAEHFGNQMNSVISQLETGVAGIGNALAATKSMAQLQKIFEKPEDERLLSPGDSIFKEISDNRATKKDNPKAFDLSVNKLEGLVNLNDEMAKAVNELKIKYNENGKNELVQMKVLNKDNKAELLFPKSKEMGKFNHTMDSIGKRIDKLDTWGILILVLFIDFIVPLGIYLLIRKKDGDEKKKKVIFGRDFNS